jgi:menaquinone-dependent protoporphyrinogen oxidase
MNSRRIVVVYGTSYGQTAKIAGRIRDALVQRGHDVTLANAAEPLRADLLDGYDGVVVGSSIIVGGHQKSVDRFVRAHLDILNRLPSAFYSVSASAGSKDAKERGEAEHLLDAFLTRVGWRPRLKASIAGAVNYTRYSRLLRWYMKWASHKGGGSTDTSRDHEYTDWTQVGQFATSIAEMVEASVTCSCDSKELASSDGAVSSAAGSLG